MNKMSLIIEWRINHHHAEIFIFNDHSGYVLYIDNVRVLETPHLNVACEKMNILITGKVI